MIENLFVLTRDLNMDVNLRDKGITAADLEGRVEAASRVPRLLNNNPKPMSKNDIRSVYNRLL
jgi:alcohol dehydrogenase class IV